MILKEQNCRIVNQFEEEKFFQTFKYFTFNIFKFFALTL